MGFFRTHLFYPLLHISYYLVLDLLLSCAGVRMEMQIGRRGNTEVLGQIARRIRSGREIGMLFWTAGYRVVVKEWKCSVPSARCIQYRSIVRESPKLAGKCQAAIFKLKQNIYKSFTCINGPESRKYIRKAKFSFAKIQRSFFSRRRIR